MADIALFPVGDGDEFDAVLLNGDFVVDNSIRTSVYVSLLSDAEDLNSPDGDPRGYWGDSLSTIQGDSTGSLWWTLSRSKQTDATLNASISYAQQALQWMLDDEVASAVSVSAVWGGIGVLDPTIEIDGPTGPQKLKLAYLWQQSLVAPSASVVPGQLLISVSPTVDGFTASLRWTPTIGAVSYAVYYANISGGQGGSPAATTTSTNAVVNGLNPDATYYFRVMALDASGDVIAISAEVTASMVTQPAPLSLRAVGCDGHINLTWNGVAGATYNVYLGTSSGGESETPIATGITETSFVVDGTVNGTTYFAQVRSVIGDLVSAPSNEASATPSTNVAPTGVVSTPNSGQVTLGWNPIAGVTFNVYQSTSPGGEGSVPVAIGIAGNSKVISGLTNCTTYYFTVGAVNACGQLAVSSEVSALVAPPLGTPGSVTAVAGNEQVSLSWSAAANAVSYNIYEGTSSGGEGTLPIATGLTSLNTTVSGLTNGTEYFYVVGAVNACGTITKSSEVSATPFSSELPYDELALSQSPALFWKFEETSGSTAVDSSGNGRNGVYGASTVFGQAALVSGYTNSVAGTGSNSAVSLGYQSPFEGCEAVSVVVWYQGTDAGGINMFGCYEFGFYPIFDLNMLSGGQITFGVFTPTGLSATSYGPDVNDGHLHCIVGTWSAASGYSRMYVDGSLVGTSINQATSALAGNGGHTISFNQEGTLAGRRNSALIYLSELSPSFISALYTAGI